MGDKYVIYLGDKVKHVSLWVREEDNEYPIYANTRGLSTWFSKDTDSYENTEPTSLSGEMVEWLAHYHRVEEGLIEHEGMFLAPSVEEDRPDVEPEWYETEILNHISRPSYTAEQRELMEWAYNRVEGNDE